MWYIYLLLFLLVIYLMFRGDSSHLKKLSKEAAKWAVQAQQDESPVLAMTHANYAAGYLWAMKDTASPREISRITGLDFATFEEHIMGVQNAVTKKALKKCPDLMGEVDLYLASVAQ